MRLAEPDQLDDLLHGPRQCANPAAPLREGIAPLVDPSPERALALNKAYRLIVVEQSFDRGRVPVLAPLDATVWRVVPEGTGTGIETLVR